MFSRSKIQAQLIAIIDLRQFTIVGTSGPSAYAGIFGANSTVAMLFYGSNTPRHEIANLMPSPYGHRPDLIFTRHVASPDL